MNRTLSYRIGTLLAALLFIVFSVGVPVVVASCPMATMMPGGKCVECNEQASSDGVTVSTQRNAACCVTVLAAERNTTEYVNSAMHLPSIEKLTAMAVDLPYGIPYAFSSVPSAINAISPSPPHSCDIPILLSSLLI